MENREAELFERSVLALERLSRETSRLRADVERLGSRIEPFENEAAFIPRQYHYEGKPKDFREVLDRFQDSRRDIEACEQHLRFIGARIDQIICDGWSREDLKPYLKENRRS